MKEGPMSLHPQVQALLDRVARSPLPPYHTVSPFVARRIYRDTRAVLAPKAPELPEVRLLAFDNFAMRVYRPVVGETLPALMYFHGRCWRRAMRACRRRSSSPRAMTRCSTKAAPMPSA